MKNNEMEMSTQKEMDDIHAEEWAKYRGAWQDTGFNVAVQPFSWKLPYFERDNIGGIWGFGFGPFHINVLLPWTRSRPNDRG